MAGTDVLAANMRRSIPSAVTTPPSVRLLGHDYALSEGAFTITPAQGEPIQGYGLDVLHELFGPFDLTVLTARDRLDYPARLDQGSSGHVDFVWRYGGGFGIRGGDRFRIGFNVELTRRDSAIPDRDFDRRRLFTTVSYGF